VAIVCMTIRVYSKTLVLGPTTRSARAGSQSAIHPKLTGRRRAGVTFRTYSHRRAARNTVAYSVGFSMERIMRVRNHSSAAVVLRHYYDLLVPLTPAARVFLNRLVPASHGLLMSALPIACPVDNTFVNPSSTLPRSYVKASSMKLQGGRLCAGATGLYFIYTTS
jgi:hypothetical protein